MCLRRPASDLRASPRRRAVLAKSCARRRAGVASMASRRRVDGVEARARELRANNRVASTALASTPSHAMIQNEDAHPPRAQAHAARAGSD